MVEIYMGFVIQLLRKWPLLPHPSHWITPSIVFDGVACDLSPSVSLCTCLPCLLVARFLAGGPFPTLRWTYPPKFGSRLYAGSLSRFSSNLLWNTLFDWVLHVDSRPEYLQSNALHYAPLLPRCCATLPCHGWGLQSKCYIQPPLTTA